jgi:hypothetical protein
MSLGIQILARNGVFSSVTWGLVAISAALVPLLGRFGDPIDELLFKVSFGLMLLVGFLTQCVPPGVKRNLASFVAAAVVVLVQYGVSR